MSCDKKPSHFACRCNLYFACKAYVLHCMVMFWQLLRPVFACFCTLEFLSHEW